MQRIPSFLACFACFACLALAVLIGCGSNRSGFDGSASGGPATAPPGGDGGLGFGDGGADEGGVADCTEDNKQIYVVTEGKELYRFDPAAKTLSKVGQLACPAGGANPFSMAVDRTGIAWVLYNDGHIFKVNTKDASCAPTSFKTGQHGFQLFGMAFVADSQGSPNETLFVAGDAQIGLGKIDTTTLALSFIGSYDGFASPAELTGTGNGKLFALFSKGEVIKDPRVISLDRTSGKIIDWKNLFGTDLGAGFAFAFWGGDFWLFTAPSRSSEITKYVYATGDTTTVKSNLDFVIVGAGVSTCAPLTPPVPK